VNRIAVLGIVVLGLIVVGSQADEIRSGLNGFATGWFHELQKPGRQANAQKRAWEAFAAKANALCASQGHRDLRLVVTSARSRAEFVSLTGAALERERNLQTALSRLQAPRTYEFSYRRFLRDRDVALAAVARARHAARENDRGAARRALRAFSIAQGSIDTFTASAGLQACR
jgi:hypothetical protein